MVVPRTLFAVAAAAALVACAEDDAPAADGYQAQDGPSAEEVQAVAAGGVRAPAPGEGGAAAPSAGGATQEIDRDTYVVRVDAPEAASVGERGAVAVHVVPKEGWKMNHEFPMLLEVEAPDGVAVEGTAQQIPDAVHYSDERGEWAVDFTPEEAGEASFEANFRFAVCTDEVCIPKREKLAWTIDVE